MRLISKRRLIYLAVVLVFSLASTLISKYTTPQRSAVSGVTTQTTNPTTNWNVVKVVDGDTIDVSQGTTKYKIRIIGINTPETVDPRRPVQCFGKEASAKAKEILTNQSVRLESDPTQSDKDKYG